MPFTDNNFQFETTTCGRWYLCLQSIHWLRRGQPALVVPRGFASDGASVPRLFWSLFPPLGRYTGAAVLHDWLYRTKAVARDVADEIFHAACLELGVPRLQALALYYGVRVGGWLAYGKRRVDGCGNPCAAFDACETKRNLLKAGLAK